MEVRKKWRIGNRDTIEIDMKKRKPVHHVTHVRSDETFRPFLVSIAVCSVTAFLFFWSIHPTHSLRPLAYLHVPDGPMVILPGPLSETEINPAVLGAQTIDPSDIVTYINEERMKQGARPLRVNPILATAAQKRANVIMKYQNFSHQDPYEHIQLDTVLPLLKYPFSWASENIGMGDNSARAFVYGFMHSPSHRDNLLNPKLVETGVAIATGPYKQYYVNVAVQIFATPVDLTTYLGYTDKDVEDYKNLLAQINNQLDLTRKLRAEDPNNAEYYDRWEVILIHQQEIIAKLSHVMENQQPFAKDMIALIKEYNTNWKSVATLN
jgi:uncharacterized protein YkwD